MFALLVVAIAAVVQGSIGMGFGQIAAAGLIWILPEYLPTLVILMALVVGGIGAQGDRNSVDLGVLSIALIGRLSGTLLALPLLLWASGDSDQFALLFASLILVAAGLGLLRMPMPFNRWTLLAGGGASGLMGTITAVGAPPMGLVFQAQTARMARPTLNAFFAIGAAISIMALSYAGLFTTDHLLLALFLMPGYVGGVLLSRRLHAFVDQRFRPLVLAFSAASACALIARVLL